MMKKWINPWSEWDDEKWINPWSEWDDEKMDKSMV
jgi:hypothetical protein